MATTPSPNVKSDLKAKHHLSSGALSGFTSAVILQPLDLLKTRFQQGYESDRTKRRRLLPVVKDVMRQDGIRGFWRGTVPTVVRNVPGVAVYFYSLSAIRTELALIPYFSVSQSGSKRQTPTLPATIPDINAINMPISPNSTLPSLPPPTTTTSSSSSSSSSNRSSSTALVRLSVQGNLMAGAIARTSVGFVLNPITVLKARYESNRYAQYRSMYSAFRSLLHDHGVRGLFQGFTATAARDAPYAGLYLVFYEKGKDIASRVEGMPSAAQHSASGASAAFLATLLTSPADTVKTRMQVNPGDHPTLRKAIMRIYLDRGLMGFFSGASLRISRKAASSAIAWTVYEASLLFLRDR